MKIFKLFSLAVFVLWGLTRPVFAIDDGNTCSFMNPMEYTITSDGYVLYPVSTDENNLCDCLEPGYYRDMVCFYSSGDRVSYEPCPNDSSYRIGVKCVECPDPKKSVENGGTGQQIARVNNNPLFIGAVNIDPEQSIEGCAVELNPEATVCDAEDDSDGRHTRVKISYDHYSKKYSNVVTGSDVITGATLFKITPKIGYYINFPNVTPNGIDSNYIDSVFENDFCKKCPDPAETNSSYDSNLWEIESVGVFDNPVSGTNKGSETCKLNLSAANSACGQSILSYVYDSGVNMYRRKGNVPSTAPANTSFVDPFPDEYDMGNDFCKADCSGGRCADSKNQCVSCPAGYYCPELTKVLMCSAAPLCEPGTFSEGGAIQCVGCATGYSTYESGPSGYFDGLCIGRMAFDNNDELSVVENITSKNYGDIGYGCKSRMACKSSQSDRLCFNSNCTPDVAFAEDMASYTDVNLDNCKQNEDYRGRYVFINNEYKKLANKADYKCFNSTYVCNSSFFREVVTPSGMRKSCGHDSSFGLGESVKIDSVNKSVIQNKKSR